MRHLKLDPVVPLENWIRIVLNVSLTFSAGRSRQYPRQCRKAKKLLRVALLANSSNFVSLFLSLNIYCRLLMPKVCRIVA